MPHITIDGIETYYEMHGEGETIVLLHNGFSCGKMWEDIYPVLVKAGYHVILFDRRGYGRTDGGPDFEKYYISDQFRALSVSHMWALLTACDIDRIHIVGQCEGGVVGVDYAASFPHQVKTLTVASTLCYSTITMEAFNRKKFTQSFLDVPPDIQEKYVYWHGSERAALMYNLASRYGGCYGRDAFDLRGVLPSLSCPVLVMYPDRGYFFEVEQGIAFYRHLSKGELAVFPRCGHNIHEHYPRQYAYQVLRFLDRYKDNE